MGRPRLEGGTHLAGQPVYSHFSDQEQSTGFTKLQHRQTLVQKTKLRILIRNRRARIQKPHRTDLDISKQSRAATQTPKPLVQILQRVHNDKNSQSLKNPSSSATHHPNIHPVIPTYSTPFPHLPIPSQAEDSHAPTSTQCRTGYSPQRTPPSGPHYLQPHILQPSSPPPPDHPSSSAARRRTAPRTN